MDLDEIRAKLHSVYRTFGLIGRDVRAELTGDKRYLYHRSMEVLDEVLREMGQERITKPQQNGHEWPESRAEQWESIK